MAELEILSLFTGAAGGPWLLIVTFLEIAVGLAILGFAIWILSPIFFYPYVHNIFGYRNGVLKYLGKAYGKEETDKKSGVVRFKIVKLFSKPKFIEPPANEYKLAFSKNKDLINLFQDNGGDLRPMAIRLNPETQEEILQPNDKDVDYWAIQEIGKAVDAYQKKDMMQQWIPLIASSVFVLFIFIFMLVLNKQMGELVSRMGQLIDALTTAFPK